MRLFPALVVVPLLLAGCSKDLCTRTAKIQEDCGETVSDADIEQCQEDLKACSKADEKKLNEAFDCLEEKDFFTCDDTTTSTSTTSGTGFGDLFAVLACFAPLEDVSEECQQSSGFDLGFTGSTSSSSWTTDTGI